MVCSYNPRTQKVSMLSIPRDTYTGTNKSTATAYQKINTLYGQSPEKLIKKINEITGLEIKYYIHVDTEALVKLVDAIGGVEFDVPIDMQYDDPSQDLHIDLKKGVQVLNGDKAEQVVRFRHNNDGSTYPSEYGQEDIGRMRTQREFLKAVIKKMITLESLTKIDEYIAIANQYVETNMNFSDFKDYVPYAVEFNMNNITSATLPGAPEKCNEIWFYIYNKRQTQTLVKEMFFSEEKQIEEIIEEKNINVSNIKIEILNGTTNQDILKDLKTRLTEVGFKVTNTYTIEGNSKTKIINRTQKSDEISDIIKQIVGAGTISSGEDNAKVDYTIIIGSDLD